MGSVFTLDYSYNEWYNQAMAKVFKNPITKEYAKKWHPTLNGDLTPADYSAGSKVKVHWVCETHGHSYYKSIQDVTKGGGCSVCSGFQVCVGFNDFESKFPDIAKEWHPTRNGDSKPTDFTYGSKYDAFWLGACGHEYQATINRRVALGNGCPYCAGQKILIGFNDLPTTHPEIVEQWDYDHNDTLPTEYTAGTNKKVYWLGTCGHSFLNSVSEKIRSAETGADGCPYCAGKQILKGFNDLESQYPLIAKEWSPKNKNRADEVSFRSTASVLWICPEGHEYKTGIRQRTLSNAGCSYCGNYRTLAHYNDATAEFPFIVEQWDNEKNGSESVFGKPKSDRTLYWWKCSENEQHSYQASISSRVDTKQKKDCDVCLDRFIQSGINDICTTHPDVSKEWDYEKNHPLLPTMVGRSYSSKVWWKCEKGHESFKSPSMRISIHGEVFRCPSCSLSVYSSSAEREISNMLEALGETVITGNRSVLKGGELDIYLPEHKLAIEFNGIYWHSLGMNGKTETYHYDKWLACKDAGVKLFHIWEDDWKKNKSGILWSIFRKLNISPEKINGAGILDIIVHPEINAENLQVGEVNFLEASTFIQKRSLISCDPESKFVGLCDSESSINACLEYQVEDHGIVNLVQYVTDRNVIHGLKLLTDNLNKKYGNILYAKLTNDTPLIDEYLSSGFQIDETLPVEFSYVIRNKRYRPTNSLGEIELMSRSQGKKIYDSGYTLVSKK